MRVLLDAPEICIFEEVFFTEILNCIKELVTEIPDDFEVSLVLTDDNDIKEINNEYRGIDSPTDVLSFPMYEPGEIPVSAPGVMLGDIVISLDTAGRQAQDASICISREIAFLFIHGFLHLMGFDHEISDEDELEMFELQESILRIWVDRFETKYEQL